VVINTDIDKMPQPLDCGKLAAIQGIPPPMYTTTVEQQTQDELSLPPLDLNDELDSESVAASQTDEKQAPLDEDADDESDEKSCEIDKKKVKKDKNESS